MRIYDSVQFVSSGRIFSLCQNISTDVGYFSPLELRLLNNSSGRHPPIEAVLCDRFPGGVFYRIEYRMPSCFES